MKTKVLCRVMAAILLIGMAGLSRASEDDSRIFTKLAHSWPKDHPRAASFYLSLEGNRVEGLPALRMGNETRVYSKVWESLYLQVVTLTGERGITGYKFAFSKDEADTNMVGTKELRDVPSLLEVSAADFRSEDNFSVRALKSGSGVPEDRGPYRLLHYDGFDVEIRVLELKIGDAILKKKPYLKSLTCLVTVTETTAGER